MSTELAYIIAALFISLWGGVFAYMTWRLRRMRLRAEAEDSALRDKMVAYQEYHRCFGYHRGGAAHNDN